MSRVCTICSHEDRDDIERAIVEGRTYRAIADDFGISRQAIDRHYKNDHISRAIAEVVEEGEVERVDDLVSEIYELKDEAKRIGGNAEGAGQYSTALMAIRELVRIVELQARIAGQIQDAQLNIQINNHPEFIAARQKIVAALEDYPEARIAVARALSGEDNG